MLKEYLEGSGYDIELRKKESSLEYDIEGFSRATGQKIIGEAKAHSKSMSGQTVAAFVGKLLPLGLLEKKGAWIISVIITINTGGGRLFSNCRKYGVNDKGRKGTL
ncbi:TPA: hypothetical protein N2386_003571 [Escherichia coli]|nr:hypothetical protein [Escherichia coli]